MKKLLLITIMLLYFLSNVFSQNILTNDYFVSATNGLFLRSEQNTKSEKIELIPFKSKVNIIKKDNTLNIIDSIKNYWYFVEYNNKKGWVFGGYLTNFNIDEIINLMNKEKIYFNNHPDLKSPQSFVGISAIYDKYIIVKIKALLPPVEHDAVGELLYTYESGKLVKYDFGIKYKELDWPMWDIKIAYVNEDNLPDLVFLGGCCGSIGFYYFSNHNNTFIEKNYLLGHFHKKNRFIIDSINSVVDLLPYGSDEDGKILKYRFDNNKDQFILIN